MDDNNKIIGCFGHFNTIHPGHQKYLRYCKEHGKKLIVFLQDESFIQAIHRPNYYSVAERYENIKNNMLVDDVVIVSKDNFANEIIKIKLDILILGNEHQSSRENYIKEIRNKASEIKYFKEGNYNFSTLPVELGIDLEEQNFFEQILKICDQNGLKKSTFFKLLNKMEN